MLRRTAARALLVACVAPVVSPGCGPAAPSRPHVVLITVDTLRADHLTPYGYGRDTSPFLATWPQAGVLFENAISQCGTTPQSLSSLLTGLYPFTDHLLTKNGSFAYLRRGNRTLAQTLRDAGYRTHAITSTIQAARVTGVDLGFESFDDVEIAPGRKNGRNRKAAEMTDLAIAWLAEHAHDDARPVFLWLHYLDPHHPYKAPPPWDELWRDEEPSEEGAERRYRYDPKDALDYPVSDGELARLVIEYDREIRYVDAELERLFEDGLGRLGENALIVFTADHGEALGDHQMIGHNDLFEPILHVPLLVRTPHGAATGRIATPVMLADVFPTVLDYAGVPLTGNLRGMSLAPLLAGRTLASERVRLAEYPAHQAVYGEGFKLVQRRKGTRAGTQLFRIVDDPAEAHDLAARDEGQVERLLASLERLRTTASDPGDADGDKPEVTPEMLEELHDLGYAGEE